jgi:phosphoglycolate phosphatase
VNIFFDLDGTLIDSKQRLYNLFQYLVPLSKLTFKDYWELKRNKISHQKILEERFLYTSKVIREFEIKWLNNIEKEEWLELDKPFEGMTAFLENLNKSHRLYLITARQSESMLLGQLKSFGWDSLFSKILVTGLKFDKYDLIHAVGISDGDWLVGDTGVDILTGKRLGLKTAAVLSGFLNKEKLMIYQPDVIVNYATDLNFR